MGIKFKLHSDKDGCNHYFQEPDYIPGECEKATGREIELRDITYIEREECENTSVVVIIGESMTGIANQIKARTLWCKYGLNLKNSELEELNQYTSDELNEIMGIVHWRATVVKVNPTKEQS